MEITSYVQPIEAVRVDASVYDIIEWFHAHKDRSFVPIVNYFSEPLGIVREQTLRDFTFTMFGRDLLKRKNISEFLSSCPIVSYGTQFEDLIQTPTFQQRKEGFIIIKGGAYGGFLPVSSLLEMYEEHRLSTMQQLLQAQKMESIGNLAGGIAHDFNNILGGITGHAALLKTKLVSPGESVSRHVSIIETLAFRGANLTKQLLGFARGGKYQVKPLNINEVISHVASITRQTFDRSITISENLFPGLNIIEGDRGQLEQVLLNLFINSRDAMPQGGTLSVKTWNLDKSTEEVFDQLNGYCNGGVGISVQDTGTGIPREIQKRIFEPFFSTKEKGKGTGMGLAMVYGIVKNHGGQIEVRSEVRNGTTFTMCFPSISAPDNPSQEECIPASRTSLEVCQEVSQARIIVVDDDQTLLPAISEYLEEVGCRVYAFSDGNRAVSFFREQCSNIELVLLDMIMPQISGKQVFNEMMQINPEVKVIFMSGYYDSRTVQDLLANAHTDFLQKPFSFENLLTAMSEMLVPRKEQPLSEEAGP